MRTSLPVRVERLWWVRRLRRLLRSLGTLPLVLDSHGQVLNAFRNSSGSLAILAAIRRASSLVRSLAARASAHSHSKAAGMLKPAALPYSPQMPTSGKGIVGAVGLAVGESHTLCPPHASQGAKVPARPQKHIARAVGLQRQFLRPAESTDNRSQDQRGAPGIGATSGKHCADTEPLRL